MVLKTPKFPCDDVRTSQTLKKSVEIVRERRLKCTSHEQIIFAKLVFVHRVMDIYASYRVLCVNTRRYYVVVTLILQTKPNGSSRDRKSANFQTVRMASFYVYWNFPISILSFINASEVDSPSKSHIDGVFFIFFFLSLYLPLASGSK